MIKSSQVLKVIGYSCGGALAASLIILLIAMSVLGFQVTHWAEPGGRFVGIAATIAGAAGAVGGLLMAVRAERRADT